MPCGEDVVRDGGGRRAEVEEVAALGWGRGGEGRAGVGEAAPGWEWPPRRGRHVGGGRHAGVGSRPPGDPSSGHRVRIWRREVASTARSPILGPLRADPAG
jgi:hypothetical protein